MPTAGWSRFGTPDSWSIVDVHVFGLPMILQGCQSSHLAKPHSEILNHVFLFVRHTTLSFKIGLQIRDNSFMSKAETIMKRCTFPATASTYLHKYGCEIFEFHDSSL